MNIRWGLHLILAAIFFGAPIVLAAPVLVVAKTIKYSIGSQTFAGYMAFDSKIPGKRPGIVIVPEWWGITKHETDAANQLARRGFTVFVIDIYGDGQKADNPQKANELMQEAQKDNYELFRRFNEGFKVLATHPTVDSKKIGAIGFGFGGGMVLDQARLGTNLTAVAVFYAGLVNDGRVRIKHVQPEILVLTGEYDQYVLPAHIRQFESEMKKAKAKFQVMVLKKAYPSFANPLAGQIGAKYQMPFSYSKKATQQSWAAVYSLFDRKFKKNAVVAAK